MYLLILVLALASVPVSAATWFHAEADGVVFAAPPGTEVEVCYQELVPGATASGPGFATEWVCTYIVADGAKNPAYFTGDVTGPMRVKARWAQAIVDGRVEPMAGHDD
jgi:hypothetical protein